MATIKLKGERITVAVHRDLVRMVWRARCDRPAFLVEAIDNIRLMKLIEAEFDAAFNANPVLLADLKLLGEDEGIELTGADHFDVPWHSIKVG